MSLNAQVPNYIPSDGLAGYWPFTNNANDSSGNSNHGVVNGATLTQDRFGNINQAYYFNGSASIICSNNSNISVDTVSVSVWIKQATVWGDGEFVCLGSDAGTNWGAIASTNNVKFNQGRGCGPTEPIALNNFTVSPNTWHHLVYVSTGFGGYSKIYYDGVYIDTTSNISSGGCAATNLFFGVDIFSIPEYITGDLDDIGIWNRLLSEDDIQDIYKGCKLSITTQPINQVIQEAGNAYFSIVTSNPTAATYTWQVDSGNGFEKSKSCRYVIHSIRCKGYFHTLWFV